MEREKRNERCVASIGFFDGVHRGHLCLVEQLCDEARRRGLPAVVVTFDRHPRAVLCPEEAPTLLTTLDEKLALLRATGVDDIVVLPFTLELSRLTALDFMRDVLRRELGVEALLLGYDHAFGHGGGTPDDYQRWGRETDIEIIRAREFQGIHISSSACRRMLGAGDVKGAAELLGRLYSLSGDVVRGFHIGHELGFPTANIQPEAEKLLPRHGAYAVWAVFPDGTRHAGMLNIGNRPTIENGEAVSIEVNLLDFEGDLYGQHLIIEFAGHLRDERKFASREELAVQLHQDEETARTILQAQ